MALRGTIIRSQENVVEPGQRAVPRQSCDGAILPTAAATSQNAREKLSVGTCVISDSCF